MTAPPRPPIPQHATWLVSPTSTCLTHSSFPKTWARHQDSVPRKGLRIPRDGQEISDAQSQSSCSALPSFCPSPEARSGEGGPGWLTSSLIVFQTMGKVPLSQPGTHSLQDRPKLGRGLAGKGGRLWERKLSTGLDDQRGPAGGRGGKQRRCPGSRQAPPPHAGPGPRHSDSARLG